MATGSRIVATVMIALLAVLSYQAEPITGTIGWIATALLTISFIMSFRRQSR